MLASVLERAHRSSRTFWSTFGILAAAALLPLWGVRHLPMVDLPQHAAQLGAWIGSLDPAWPFHEILVPRWFTPYWGAYLPTLLLTTWLPVATALRLVIGAAVVAYPLTLIRLFRVANADRWWALLGFPLAYGFAFGFGLLNFVVATPIAVLFLAAALRHLRAPSRDGGLRLALFSVLLVSLHLLLAAVSITAAGLAALATLPDRRTARAGLVPLAAGGLAAVGWLLAAGSGTQYGSFPIRWLWNSARPAFWFGFMSLSTRFGSSIGYGALLTVCPVLLGSRPRRNLVLWAPFATVLLVLIACPSTLLDVALIYPRFGILFAPFLHLALRPGREARWAPVVVVALALPQLLLLSDSNRRFDAEAAPIDRVLAVMEPGLQAVGFVEHRHSEIYPLLPLHEHLGAWYQATGHGLYDPSFSGFRQTILAFRRDIDQPGRRRYFPAAAPFDWTTHLEYDYYLFGTGGDPRPVMASAPFPCELEIRAGRWWLFRRTIPSTSPSPAAAPPAGGS